MKIAFIGTVEFSYNALQLILAENYNVVGVITKASAGFNSDFVDLSPLCKQNNIPYKAVKDINDSENVHWLKSLQPDVIFCFGWSQLLKNDILNICRLGVIGYHPAMLPANKGRHPLIWALVLGLEKTGSTFFRMDQGADTGDILSQEEIIIDINDDARSLYNKTIKTALNQIKNFLPRLSNNTFKLIPQEKLEGNNWRKRRQIDGKIDFRMTSRSIHNLVRALSDPYPGAHIECEGKDIKVWKVKEIDIFAPNIEPGKVLSNENATITVKTIDSGIILLKHEFEILPKIGSYL